MTKISLGPDDAEDFLLRMANPAAFERMQKWDLRFLGVAKHISAWSKDPSTKVGAVLVNGLDQVVGLGYNGFPRGVDDTEERYNNRDLKYPMVVHAEVNAIIQARNEARGSTLYVYPSFMLPPICAECAKVAIQAGVKGIVGYEPNETDERVKRWAGSISHAKTMWEEAGLFIRSYKEESSKDFPYLDGDFTILGPEVFTDKDESVISWKGENYYRRDDATT